MSDVLAASYDALPYRHGAVAETHPARLGAIGRLLGRNCALPEACRVLELGCGEGMNLLPLAERFPNAQFVGVDFSSVQIAVGEQARRAAELGNVRFVCADLRTFEPEPGGYDYVIAHGVYSWVSAPVRDCLLAICAKALAPDGLAYVSYNVYPAWGVIAGLRAMLQAELLGSPDPIAQLARTLPVLERALSFQPGPYAAHLRELLAEMAAKPPQLLFHDELESVNDPVTFLDFSAHAQSHGLQYLAEAHFASMPVEHLPVLARQALQELAPDFSRSQHYLDLLGNRRFRNSLLVPGAPPTTRQIDPAVITQCAIGLHLHPRDGRIDLASEALLQLVGRHGFQLSVSDPGQKAFFAALCEAAPGRIPFADALERAAQLLDQPQSLLDPAPLALGLAKLFSSDQCDLVLAGSGEWLRIGPKPAPSALMAYQARNGFHITNRWQEVMELSEEERLWVGGAGPARNVSALIRSGLAV